MSPPPFVSTVRLNRRGSLLVRALAIAWLGLIVYLSLAPWSGWRDLGVSPWAYLAAPWPPPHVTRFDVFANLVAYVPLGALLALAVYPLLRGLAAATAATLACLLLSGGAEALQTFLPQRVPSAADLLANAVGGALGALLAAPLAAGLIDRGRLLELRYRWFARGASALLVVLAAWPVAQGHPLPMLFGFGVAPGALLETASALGPAWLPAREAWQPADFVLGEAFVAGAGLLAAGLALAATLRPGAPRLMLLAAFVLAALAAKSFAYGLRFGPGALGLWMTPGALGGLLLGAMALAVAATGSARMCALTAGLAVLLGLLAVAIVPPNPYFIAAQDVAAGRFRYLAEALGWLAQAWPFALLAALPAAAGGARDARR